jgi:hypothetical protein
MARPRLLLGRAWRGTALVAALVSLTALSVVVGVTTRIRRARGMQPRVVWGPTPLINLKYWSQSLQRYGFASTTLVNGVYPAFRRQDFDRYVDSFGPRRRRLRFLAPYFAFAWCLLKADVYVVSYDGGQLGLTPLRSLECQLSRLAGKRTVVVPYGSDIAVPGTMGPVEAGVYAAYPDLLRRADEIRDRILYLCKQADFVVRTYQPGYQPRQDLLWPNALGIDAAHWQPLQDSPGQADARDGEVVVLHPTNHRSVKGTEFLVAAVDRLRASGLNVRLEILEGRPNEEVRAAMGRADIVAEQFIAGYGLTAVEAMALGRPVMSNLTWLPAEFWEGTYLRECPIVNATPETLEDCVRDLATQPELRDRLGRAGREYVLKYHSAEAVGQIWKSILRHVWSDAAIPPKVSFELLSASGTG